MTGMMTRIYEMTGTTGMTRIAGMARITLMT